MYYCFVCQSVTALCVKMVLFFLCQGVTVLGVKE